MLDPIENIDWRALAAPLAKAERELGRLAHALDTTPLHATWLWREVTRAAVAIVQASGHLAKTDQLRLALIGVPVDLDDNTAGLAAAKRIFLTATPLFRESSQTDSETDLWPTFWHGDTPSGGEAPRPRDLPPKDETLPDRDRAGEEARPQQGDQLMVLVRELAGFADDGRRPALINLLVDLRRHAAARRLPPHLVRLALPLALAEAGILPKPAPGLLGGRRLPLGMSRAVVSEKPLTDWLVQALNELAREANQSYRRLIELGRQHRSWHAALGGVGLRRHAKAPAALDLLAATPVLSIGLVARHLGCSHVASGKIVERLVATGILIEQSARSRHKIFIAGDLPTSTRSEADPDGPLSFSEPTPSVDVDALSATLNGLFADLDRLNQRTKERIKDGTG